MKSSGRYAGPPTGPPLTGHQQHDLTTEILIQTISNKSKYEKEKKHGKKTGIFQLPLK